mgnify:CR=1 FL=1
MRSLIRVGALLGSFVLALVVTSVLEASAAPTTCASTRCKAGFHCVDMPTGAKCVPNTSCADVRCKAGTHCIETPAPKCVTDLTCANVRCRKGTHCVDKPTGPQCVRGPATPPKY